VGAEIFATAGSPEKRAFLASLGVEHCMDSRSLEFADEIMEITEGRGVDVVLNSLPGEFITRSLAVLAPYGRFVEIGRTDIYQNRQIGLLPFQNNLSYFAVDLEKLCRERSELVRALFEELMQALAEGSLRPLPHRVFGAEEIVGAFRYMAQRRNIGKIVVSTRAPEAEEAPREPSEIRADATYLVTGGCGGLGLAVARWLAERGARHLVLLGRSGAGEDAEPTLEALRQEGVSVVVGRADVADRRALAQMLSEIRETLPPLRGIVHAAGVIEDGLLARLEPKRFRAVFAPKLAGAWNLHLLTRDDPLDFLVLFSSVASVLGSPGQGNYAAANAFLDALAHHRRALGLPATSVQWGPWAEVGMAARGGLERILEKRGMRPMAADSALEVLEEATQDTRPQTLVASIDWPRLLAGLGETRRSQLLVDLAAECGDPQQLSENAGREAERVLALAADERQGALVELIQSELSTIMGLELAELDAEEPLVYVGLDSLMAIELKERLESSLGVTLGIEHLVDDPTIRDVAEIALEELTRDEETCQAAPA
jgi:NADPH:quinone reductase-like Zn-dependent oxidoreductase/aryl carrier-like protein